MTDPAPEIPVPLPTNYATNQEGHVRHHNKLGYELNMLRVALPVITPERYGAVGDGIADDTVAVAAAFTAASNLRRGSSIWSTIWYPGATVALRGIYNCSTLTSPLIASCNVTGGGATIITPEGYGDTGILVGHGTFGHVLHDATLVLPNMHGISPDTLPAWSSGVTIQNLTHSVVQFGRIIFYETAHYYRGEGIGVAYNTFFPGWIDMSKVGYKLTSGSDGTGWVNQNTWVGGGISQSPGWGLPYRAPGWRHVVMEGGTGNPVHGNTFVGQSYEGNMSEFFLELHNAQDNQWLGATRFEQGDLGTTVTANPALNSFATVDPHGFAVGDMVCFYAATYPAGLTALLPYYVNSVAGVDFTVSTTKGGPTVDFTTAGTGVRVLRPPAIRSDNTDGNTYGNRIHDGYNSWPGALEPIQIGSAGLRPMRSGLNC